MRGTRLLDVLALAGLGASVWLYTKYGLLPGLGAFAACIVILLVIKVATAPAEPQASPSATPAEIVVRDYRPEWEKTADVEARSALGDPEDEQYAHALVSLLAARDRDRIREIGKHLDEHGGIQRMVRICLRVKHLGGDASALERRHWDGIGEWQG
jgi:hypothetical protein